MKLVLTGFKRRPQNVLAHTASNYEEDEATAFELEKLASFEKDLANTTNKLHNVESEIREVELEIARLDFGDQVGVSKLQTCLAEEYQNKEVLLEALEERRKDLIMERRELRMEKSSLLNRDAAQRYLVAEALHSKPKSTWVLRHDFSSSVLARGITILRKSMGRKKI
mmetsp:Transcript_3386/g.6500  ORF Transcript_3386/g.6500 Transcript_3386/m.6500 type:complete len:168 (+) Transcript_3386:391-894(+)